MLAVIFGLSGVFEMATSGAYRQSYGILLLLPLVVLFKLRVDAVLVVSLLMAAAIILSSALNHSSLSATILFLRGPVASYLAWHVIRGWLGSNQKNANALWKFLFVIGSIQLPVVLAQTIFWQELAAFIPGSVSLVDVGFGTFPIKADYSMAFYLVMMILALMYSKSIPINAKPRWFLLTLYSLTILIANSQMAHLVLVFVWTVYLLQRLSPKMIRNALLLSLVVSIVLVVFLEAGLVPLDISATVRELQRQVNEFRGIDTGSSFARGATISHFLTEPLSFFGAGPGFYHDVIGRQVQGLDVQGHLLIYYAEVGFVGAILSYIFVWVLANPVKGSSFRLQIMPYLAFVAMVIMSTTTHVLNQLPIVVVYMLVITHYQFERDTLRSKYLVRSAASTQSPMVGIYSE